MLKSPCRIAGFATKGTGSNDDLRLRALLRDCNAEILPYDKSAKRASACGVVRWVAAHRPELLVMEGTGLSGGLACMVARMRYGCRYVVSSGDAVGPFVSGIAPLAGPCFALYERLLCRLAAGFIGWTPYLAGRALTFGTTRAMSAAGWCDRRPSPGSRSRVRRDLGIPDDALVVGLLGSLQWNRRYRYCYGLELVRARARVDRADLYVLIGGSGSGLDELKREAGALLDRNVLLPGPIATEHAVDFMTAMDLGSLPQTVDGVGSFRYTTKLSEYLAANLPVITGQIPLAYDLDDGWILRLPGDTPWSSAYQDALAAVLQTVTAGEINKLRTAIPPSSTIFDRERQIGATSRFIGDLLERRREEVGAV